MNKSDNWKILQIIPAQSGWTAVHCQESKNHEITIFNRPIICWAVVEAVARLQHVVARVLVQDDQVDVGQVSGVLGAQPPGRRSLWHRSPSNEG